MNVRPFVFGSLAALLAACGGGGGGSDSATIPAAADGPTLSVPGQFPAGVAYLADAEVDDRFELYTAALDGSAYARLSAPLTPLHTVWTFAWSPDRSRIAYVVVDNATGTSSLFVATVDTGAVVPIAPSLSAGEVAWSPDSTRIATRAGSSNTLWSVRADGTGLVRISAPEEAGRYVTNYEWSPDSTHLAYVSDELVDDVARLHVVPAAGGTSVEVSAFLPAGDQVGVAAMTTFPVTPAPFAWSPDSSTLAFQRLRAPGPGVDLQAVAADGTSPVLLSPPVAGTRVLDFAWAPNGSRVAFQSRTPPATTFALRTVTPAGTDPQVLNDTVSYGLVVTTHGFAWAPDSTQVAFLGYGPGTGEALFVGPAAGGTVGWAGIGLGFGDFPFFTLTWSPDSAHLAFLDESVDPRRLYVAEAATFQQNRFAAEGSPLAPSWAPDGTQIAYLSDPIVAQRFEALVSAEMSEYGTVRVSPPLDVVSHGAMSVAWSGDGAAVLSVTDPRGRDVRELFAAAPDGTHLRRLSGPLVDGGMVGIWLPR